MTTRIVTDSNGRKHITNEPMLHKPCRQWVGLTDEDKKGFWTADQMTNKEWSDLFTAIESKLREKNT
jgi:hypothetical protein